MQSSYAERFEREMGCTEAEWLRWLPDAIGDLHWKHQAQTVGVRIGVGVGASVYQGPGLKWQVGEPRVLGLAHLPRLYVQFRFAGVDETARYTFMKRFDLYMHRGGG